MLGWPLILPFYGPLAGCWLQEQATWGTGAFTLGLALGYALAAWPGRQWHLPPGWSAVLAIALVVLCFPRPALPLTVAFMLVSGILTASPTLAWTSYLAGMEKRVLPFAVGVLTANLLVYGAVWAGPGSLGSFLLAATAAAVFVSVAFVLGRENAIPVPVARGSSPWPLLWPLLIFIVASGYVGGLLYGVIIPALEGWHGIGWLSVWPYMLAFALASFIASRRYELLPAVTLSVYGLALLPLSLPVSANSMGLQLASLTGTMIGAAFSDAFIWLSLIYLTSRGHPRVVATGLALNVFLIWAITTLSELVMLDSAMRLPLAALLGAALLFILIPLIVPRLAPSPAGVHRKDPAARAGVLGSVVSMEFSAALTEAEGKVYQLLLLGNSNHKIASELFVTVNTVKYHVRNILRKVGCKNRQELIERVLLSLEMERDDFSLPERTLEERVKFR